jgi:hypothetical protein
MRGSTVIWIGINHVGVKSFKPDVRELTVANACKWILEFMRDTTLAQRIDIVIARTEGEVLQRLNERGGQRSEAFEVPDDFWNNLEDELTQGEN